MQLLFCNIVFQKITFYIVVYIRLHIRYAFDKTVQLRDLRRHLILFTGNGVQLS